MHLARQSAHANALAHITRGAQPLPDVLRLPILTGVASLMAEIEWSPQAGVLCGQLATALGDVLAEFDIDRPTTIAAALMQDPAGRDWLLSWSAVVQIARVMLLTAPRGDQTMYNIASLCNLALERLISAVRGRLQQVHDPSSIQHATSPLGYALTLYTDAARQLNEALGVVVFTEPPPLGGGAGMP